MSNPSTNTVSGWRCDVWHQRFSGVFDGETDAASATCRLVKVTYGAGTTRFRDHVCWFDTAENAAAALALLETPSVRVERLSSSALPLSGVVEFEVVVL